MFAAAMMKNLYTTTWNNAKSLSTPDPANNTDGRVSLFFKAMRGIDDTLLYQYLEKSSCEDLVDTFVLVFQTRDCRGGKGERELGRKMFRWLFLHRDSDFEKVFHLIPEYGRWDDCLQLFPNILTDLSENQQRIQKRIVKLYGDQLKVDVSLMGQGKPTSICAKWCPSENDSDDKKYKLVKTLCEELKITPRQYRKEYTGPLRSYIKIVEKFMCSGQWDKIELEKVPSCAIKRLKKAFEKHIPDEFNSWKNGLKSGVTSVKAKQLFPHEIIREIRTKGYADEVCSAQWEVLEKEVRKLGTFENSVVVVDTSSSMHTPDYLPFDNACALGLIISNAVSGEFHNNVITFNDTPEFVLLEDGDIESRFNQIKEIPWGGSTNIQKTFDMILEKGIATGLTEAQMPKRIYIISDMQFNSVNGYGNSTNFEEIDRKYKESPYTRPQIVFWNVNGTSTDFPVTVDDNGTCLISGSSPSILKSILKTTDFNSVSIMREALDDERYQEVRKHLKQ